MKPGTAFIPATDEVLYYDPSVYTAESALRALHNVPAGYVWSPKTEGTMAGWVRPRGRIAGEMSAVEIERLRARAYRMAGREYDQSRTD